jgi:hypothetical protein
MTLPANVCDSEYTYVLIAPIGYRRYGALEWIGKLAIPKRAIIGGYGRPLKKRRRF